MEQYDQDDMQRLKALFLSEATVTPGAHSTAVRSYIFYCVHVLGINPIQPPRADATVRALYETVIEDWSIWAVTYMPSGRQLSADSQGKYVSTLRAWYKRYYRATLGLGAADSRIGEILKGMKRVLPQPPPRERDGCTPADLAAGFSVRHPLGPPTQSVAAQVAEVTGRARDVAAQLEERCGAAAGPESQMWRSATTFGMAGLARGCELALSGGEVFDALEHVTERDVSFFYRGGVRHARVRMRKRKDLRLLRGKHHTVVLGGGGQHIDAVAELFRWVETRRVLGLPSDGPLWCWAVGRAITVDELRDEVRALMAAAGRDPARYGAHSLRIGGATAALAAGVPPAVIRVMGRWSSDIYEIYTRMSVEAALGVGAAIGSASVTRPDEGFHEEHFELLPSEIDFMPAASASGGGEDEA